jgi:cytochrome c-type biogenesis protein CcmE
MDPSKKRQIRLFVALGFAVLLATGLVYTSFNASSEARQPSELADATPGKSYERTGKVVPGSIRKDGDGKGISFRVSDRDGGGEIPVTYDGVVPDPFRDGREIVLKGTVENGIFVGERDTLVTKCPSKFSEKQNK